jgi:signal transduction histidine kinase
MIERPLEPAGEAPSTEEQALLIAELEAAVRVRNDFLSLASHELKTPLAALALHLDLLQREVEAVEADEPRERMSDRLDRALRQTQRLGRLVEELLDVARVVSGSLRFDLEAVDLGRVVREVAARHAEAGVMISVDGERTIVGHWDKLMLEHVAQNLVDNAVKYGQRRPIEIELLRRGPDALLCVRDHGIGIAPSDLERIFERFERAVSPRQYGGLGLGLWIVRQIVEGLGGQISVDSVPGQGACFTVALPVGELV